VDLDASGNLWVVDSGNNRVLRFPPGSKTADLVLGQSGFTSRGGGTGLNQMWDPSAVRVSPTSGWVYVSESKNNRVMVYKPPFATGMAGSLFNSFGTGLYGPQGVDFDPSEPGAVWISNHQHTTIELWSESTQTKIKEVGWRDNGNVIGSGTGSVGIDSAGNLYVAIGEGEHDNDVLVFDKGAALDLPTKQLFGTGGNLPTASGLGWSVEGVVVSDGQLIVADRQRLLFWNNPASAVNGQPADGYAGTSGFADVSFPCCGIMTADKNHHLWVTRYPGGDTPVKVDVYQLPLALGAAPIQSLFFPFNVLGGGQITASRFAAFTGIAVSDAGELWLGHSETNRVFRLRNPLTAPLVDVILGQLSSAGTACNRGGGTVSNSLCLPGHVSLDRLGNVFVSDDSLEAQGNFRLLEFSKNLLPSGNATVIYAPAAAKIFPNSATWQPAFDSHNHMVVGYNPYITGPNPLGGWFPGIYGDPLSGPATPDAYLLDYHSMAYSAVFDENDNLYIADLDRSRVLYYDKPTAFLPAILGFAPLNGPVGSAVTITGTKLIDTTAVRFHGISATFTVDSDTQLTTTVPAGATTGSISVSTPAGGAGSLADFGVGSAPAPAIKSFSPTRGAVGASVGISGTNFTGATSVTFNGLSAGFTVNTATKITATVPSGATTGPISVATPNGTATTVGNFTVAPRITSFTPGSGDVGTSVVITGANFTGATAVKFNGTSAVYHVDSSTQITATVPANATTGAISVTTQAGTGTSLATFTVAPRITSFTPTSGPVGTSVTINGANFTGTTSVNFNGVSAGYTFNSSVKITATVPAGATTGKISVTTPVGTGTSTGNFTVKPNITNFTPGSGNVGDSVTITGTAFTGVAALKFNGVSSTFHVDSSTQITATVPANATTGPISVTTAGSTATSSTNFTVAPRITGFTPASGPVGKTVAITGANFTGATSVTFNGASATFTFNSSTKVTATVPAGATTGKITVTTSAGTATSSSDFTVL
jgi:hypothetical protein